METASKPVTERGMCPKCRRYHILDTTGDKRTCPICGHTWKISPPKA